MDTRNKRAPGERRAGELLLHLDYGADSITPPPRRGSRSVRTSVLRAHEKAIVALPRRRP
jgi:hypothetical protein